MDEGVKDEGVMDEGVKFSSKPVFSYLLIKKLSSKKIKLKIAFMEKTIKYETRTIGFNCAGKNADSRVHTFYELQDFVEENFPHLMIGAIRIGEKRFKEEETDKRIESISYTGKIDSDGIRGMIEINGTVIDNSGISRLCKDSTEVLYRDGKVMNKKKLRVKDIEKAIDNIQLLVDESSIKPVK